MSGVHHGLLRGPRLWGRRWLELKWLTAEVKDKDGKKKLQSSKAGDGKG